MASARCRSGLRFRPCGFGGRVPSGHSPEVPSDDHLGPGRGPSNVPELATRRCSASVSKSGASCGVIIVRGGLTLFGRRELVELLDLVGIGDEGREQPPPFRAALLMLRVDRRLPLGGAAVAFRIAARLTGGVEFLERLDATTARVRAGASKYSRRGPWSGSDQDVMFFVVVFVTPIFSATSARVFEFTPNSLALASSFGRASAHRPADRVGNLQRQSGKAYGVLLLLGLSYLQWYVLSRDFSSPSRYAEGEVDSGKNLFSFRVVQGTLRFSGGEGLPFSYLLSNASRGMPRWLISARRGVGRHTQGHPGPRCGASPAVRLHRRLR